MRRDLLFVIYAICLTNLIVGITTLIVVLHG